MLDGDWSSDVCSSDLAHIAVAANFMAPMQQMLPAFEAATGHKLQLSSGSTGKFYAQIKNGAPFDVLLAADDETPIKLEQEGAAVAGSRFSYAIGKLVLWSASVDGVDAKGEVLRQGKFSHLAIANPKLAPYGRAAQESLQALGLWDGLQGKLVTGENIAQTQQFVASGNAQLGLLALSQVWRDGRLSSGSAWLVPEKLHAPIRQDAVLLLKGKDNPAAQALLSYLRSDAAKAVLRSYGYSY
jgi:molybdate transport system substrate-binding protein